MICLPLEEEAQGTIDALSCIVVDSGTLLLSLNQQVTNFNFWDRCADQDMSSFSKSISVHY